MSLQMKFILPLTILVVVVVGVIGAIYWHFNQPMFDCRDTILLENVSPDKKWILTAFIRDCGATTDYSTIISIREQGKWFDSKRDPILFVVSGKEQLNIKWENERRVVIEHQLGRIFRQETKWNNLQVTYRLGKN